MMFKRFAANMNLNLGALSGPPPQQTRKTAFISASVPVSPMEVRGMLNEESFSGLSEEERAKILAVMRQAETELQPSSHSSRQVSLSSSVPLYQPEDERPESRAESRPAADDEHGSGSSGETEGADSVESMDWGDAAAQELADEADQPESACESSTAAESVEKEDPVFSPLSDRAEEPFETSEPSLPQDDFLASIDLTGLSKEERDQILSVMRKAAEMEMDFQRRPASVSGMTAEAEEEISIEKEVSRKTSYADSAHSEPAECKTLVEAEAVPDEGLVENSGAQSGLESVREDGIPVCLLYQDSASALPMITLSPSSRRQSLEEDLLEDENVEFVNDKDYEFGHGENLQAVDEAEKIPFLPQTEPYFEQVPEETCCCCAFFSRQTHSHSVTVTKAIGLCLRLTENVSVASTSVFFDDAKRQRTKQIEGTTGSVSDSKFYKDSVYLGYDQTQIYMQIVKPAAYFDLSFTLPLKRLLHQQIALQQLTVPRRTTNEVQVSQISVFGDSVTAAETTDNKLMMYVVPKEVTVSMRPSSLTSKEDEQSSRSIDLPAAKAIIPESKVGASGGTVPSEMATESQPQPHYAETNPFVSANAHRCPDSSLGDSDGKPRSASSEDLRNISAEYREEKRGSLAFLRGPDSGMKMPSLAVSPDQAKYGMSTQKGHFKFGGLINRTKSDLSFFATTVKSHTEAALKRATESIGGTLSSVSSFAPPEAAAFTSSISDNKRLKDFVDSQKIDSAIVMHERGFKSTPAMDYNPEATTLEQAPAGALRSSYSSDTTEDTGYSSRCSPVEDDFRFSSYSGTPSAAGTEPAVRESLDRRIPAAQKEDPRVQSISQQQRYNPFIDYPLSRSDSPNKTEEEHSSSEFTEEERAHLAAMFLKAQELQAELDAVSPTASERREFISSLPELHQKNYASIPTINEIQATPEDTTKVEERLPQETDDVTEVVSSDAYLSSYAQLYDSSDVSSDITEEEEQNRRREIESEFAFPCDSCDETNCGSGWQMCPLCQMTLVQTDQMEDGASGHTCVDCRLVVCTNCSERSADGLKREWLCKICQSRRFTDGQAKQLQYISYPGQKGGLKPAVPFRSAVDVSRAKTTSEELRKTPEAITSKDNDESEGSDNDSISDEENYPDVVIEVPSSPVSLTTCDDAENATNSESAAILKELEKFTQSLVVEDDDSVFMPDIKAVSSENALPANSVGETLLFLQKARPAVTAEAKEATITEAKVAAALQLACTTAVAASVDDLTTGQSLPATSTETDTSIDYSKAVKYYSSPQLCGHRPGPVYTIPEVEEETSEEDVGHTSKSANGKKEQKLPALLQTSSTSLVTSDLQSVVNQASTVTSVAVSTLLSDVQYPADNQRLSLHPCDVTSVVSSKEYFSEKNRQTQQDSSQPSESYSVKAVRQAPPPPVSAALSTSNGILQLAQSSDSSAAFVVQEVAVRTCADNSSTEAKGFMVEDGRLTMSSCVLPSSSINQTSLMVAMASTRDDRLKLWSQRYGLLATTTASDTITPSSNRVVSCSGHLVDEHHEWSSMNGFVSRLKRSPAMILSQSGEPQHTSESDPVPVLGVFAKSFPDTLVQKKETEVTASSQRCFEMGRRKLPSIPTSETARSGQRIRDDLATASDRAAMEKGSHSQQQQQQYVNRLFPWGTAGLVDQKRRLAYVNSQSIRLPCTLARVLLKQELREVLSKRLQDMHASEAEANQRQYQISRYMTTGIYPKTARVDSTPRVVYCGLPAELVRGTRVVYIKPETVKRSQSLSVPSPRSSSSVIHAALQSASGRWTSHTTREPSQPRPIALKCLEERSVQATLLKDEETQTISLQPAERSSFTTEVVDGGLQDVTADSVDVQRVDVSTSTEVRPVFKSIATDTRDLQLKGHKTELNKASRKTKAKKSFVSAYFSDDDDSEYREFRKSKIRNEIARRRERFSSRNDFGDLAATYLNDPMVSSQTLPPMGSSFGANYMDCRQNPFRQYSTMDSRAQTGDQYSSLRYYHRMHPMYHSDAGYLSDFQDYTQCDFGGCSGDLANVHRKSLSTSLPYLNRAFTSPAHPADFAYGSTVADADVRDKSLRSHTYGDNLVSHYASYLNNEFLRRPSAVNDYQWPICQPRDASRIKQPLRSFPSYKVSPLGASASYQDYLPGTSATVDSDFAESAAYAPFESKAPLTICQPLPDVNPRTAVDHPYDGQSRFTNIFQPSYSTFSMAHMNPVYDRSRNFFATYSPHAFPFHDDKRNAPSFDQRPSDDQAYSSCVHLGLGGCSRSDVCRSLQRCDTVMKRLERSDYPSGPIKRILLTRAAKDKSAKGLGMRVIGGKILPGSERQLVAYVAAIYKGGLVDTMGEVSEGDQILKWNGMPLTGKTYEEVQQIVDSSQGEIEILVRSGTNLHQVYRLQDDNKSADKGYESGSAPSGQTPGLEKALLNLENKRRTRFISNTCNPEWNQTVVYKEVNEIDLAFKYLEFTVWDFDRVRENIFLGKVVLILTDPSIRWGKMLWYALQPRL